MKTSTFSIHKIIFMYKKTMVTYFPADFPLPMEVEKMVCELKWINPVKLLVCLQGSFFRVIFTGGYSTVCKCIYEHKATARYN